MVLIIDMYVKRKLRTGESVYGPLLLVERRFGISCLLGTERPHSARLLTVDALSNLRSKFLECWVFFSPLEEASLPLATFFFLFLTQLSLAILDDSFLVRCCIHVTLANRRSYFLPRTTGFQGVLLLNWSNTKWCGFGRFGVVSVNGCLAFGILDGKTSSPLAIDLI